MSDYHAYPHYCEIRRSSWTRSSQRSSLHAPEGPPFQAIAPMRPKDSVDYNQLGVPSSHAVHTKPSAFMTSVHPDRKFCRIYPFRIDLISAQSVSDAFLRGRSDFHLECPYERPAGHNFVPRPQNTSRIGLRAEGRRCMQRLHGLQLTET